MKKIFFGLMAITMISFTTNAQKVGALKDGKPVVTENMDFLKKAWESMLAERKTPTALVNFEIIIEKYELSGKWYYLIVASNEDKTIKVAKQLMIDKADFFIYNKRIDGSLAENTCTCFGCGDGCNPKLEDNGNFICSACVAGKNTCHKTTTF